jgi:regulator of protease activity HflC (stomatin/prohibitin superfamily)
MISLIAIEGVYIKDSPLFIFEKCISASEKQITLGARKIITVWDGEVGVSYYKGKLVVLKPDRHIIDSIEHVFQGFISTQQQCLHLASNKNLNDQDGILVCETKDFVEIGLKADVFFKISDAEKVLMIVGKDNVATLVRETAIATLNSIIRSTSLAEVAQNKEIAAKSEKQHNDEVQKNPGTPSAPMFFDKVHDEFISKLHDTFVEHYGIAITNIRIESFKIMNAELATNISKQAFVTAQTETQLSVSCLVIFT